MRALVALGIGCALVGCADNNSSVCGDGVCDSDETARSCAADCSVVTPTCGDGVCNGSENATNCSRDCTSSACSSTSDQCPGETICIASQCQAAFPRVYQITNVSVTAPPYNNGQAWDADGSAPDLYLSSGGTVLTPYVPDSLTANFPGPFEFTLVAGGTLEIDVYDDDVGTDDGVIGCASNPITAATLRSRSFGCSGAMATLTSTIQPK